MRSTRSGGALTDMQELKSSAEQLDKGRVENQSLGSNSGSLLDDDDDDDFSSLQPSADEDEDVDGAAASVSIPL